MSTTPAVPYPVSARPGTVRAWHNSMKLHDKLEPPPGPWLDEPTKMQWVDDDTGLPCLIVRNHSGALCGYVGLQPGHPLHGKHYDAVNVDVHGGLTFADGCQHPADESTGICHIAEPGTSDDVWWFGFDTAHSGDLIPAFISLHEQHRDLFPIPTYMGDTYKDLAYVGREVRSLAQQLGQPEAAREP
jgi:hypothetical protein